MHVDIKKDHVATKKYNLHVVKWKTKIEEIDAQEASKIDVNSHAQNNEQGTPGGES
jgi:hypothetical protein